MPATDSLAGRTMIVSGGSRGIGHAIALGVGSRGANVVLMAQTDLPHPKLPGTIHSVAEEVEVSRTWHLDHTEARQVIGAPLDIE